MALTNEKVFLTGDTGTTALNAYTGTVIWNEEIPADDLISAGEWIYRLDKTGGLACYNGPSNLTAPVTELTVEPAAPDGQNGYYLTKPVITLSSVDTESYAAEVMYSLNESGYVNYTEPFEMIEGFVSMSWYAVDNHGYREDSQIATYNVDSGASGIDNIYRIARIYIDNQLYFCYTIVMKTAISIPDNLFNDAEITAKQLGLARSQLYVRAIKEFIEHHNKDKITEKLNLLYSETEAEYGLLDMSIESMREATKNDSW